MTQRVWVGLKDDIDGTSAFETIFFSLDGVPYQIDLSDENSRKIRRDFGLWIAHARRVGGRRRRGVGYIEKSSLNSDTPQAIRAWAREMGYVVNDSGRLPDRIIRAYEQR